MTVDASVIIPVRNGANFIAEAVESTLIQLDAADEVIVVNDGSTDDTLSVVDALADHRVRILSSLRRGVSSARNTGLAAARGEVVAFLDHDDYWPAGRHRIMRALLRENPTVGAVYGRVRLQAEAGAPHLERFANMDGQFLAVGQVGSGLFRRSVLDRIDGFAEDMQFGEDVDFQLRLLEAGMQVERCEIESLIYRRHAANATNDHESFKRGVFEILRRRTVRARSGSPM